MKITYIEGDLFEPISKTSDTTFIPHVVNNRGAFGSGFVLPLGRTFPKAKQDYLDWSNGVPSFDVPFELGQTLFSTVGQNPHICIAHMNAQTLGGARPLFYNKLVVCMEQVADHIIEFHKDAKIVAPMFGSQLAGGRWDFIEELIEDCWLRREISVNIHYIEGQTPPDWVPPD